MAGAVNILDILYPKLLKDIPSPPKNLYYKGNFREELFENCLAVVGSRRMSIYGEKVIEKIFAALSKNITIVSGFMSGVDAEAHRQALRFGLKTIAVMPCGIDCIHPEDQEELYKKIISELGLILSEFEGNFKPKIWTYPKRNKIVAGLSKAVLVIEASKDSGSLITARIANSFGRKVFVIPGSIFSTLSSGKVQICNEFASTIDSGFNINKFFGLEFSGNGIFGQGNQENENKSGILDVLRDSPMTIDDLAKYLSVNVSEISTELTLLSMNNLVTEQGGKFYAC